MRVDSENTMVLLDGERTADELERVSALPLSFEEYAKIEERRKRARSRVLWSIIAVGTICVPIAYLKMTGQFSSNFLRHDSVALDSSALKSTPVYDPLAEPKRTPAEQARFDKLKTDVRTYVTQDLASLAPQEKIAIYAFSGVTGRQFRDTATTMRVLRYDVIPAQEKFVAQASTLRPQSPEIAALNQQLVTSAKMRLRAYRTMLAGENDPDALWKYAFDADFKDADDRASSFRTQLGALSHETGVIVP